MTVNPDPAAGTGSAQVSVPVPVLPIEVGEFGVGERLGGPRVRVTDALLERLRGVCAEVATEPDDLTELGRDWWPLAARWATRGQVPALPGAVAKPTDATQVAAVLAACNDARVPVTPAAGRSGVCGGSVPVFGGISLDLCGLRGISDFDDESLLADVLPGTFGPDLEADLRRRGTTLGHWPQSMALSTVGGWIACRGAGQYSTRYGKIEDMVVGLEVALADGTLITTGSYAPRAASGPELSQLFIGSEGTLGVITSAKLRLHMVPPTQKTAAYGFRSFADGMEACRNILRRGATPAVLRLYDEVESARNFSTEGVCVLIVLDEAEEQLVDATMSIVEAECFSGSSGLGSHLDVALVEQWLGHRNDVSALAPLVQSGFVVDTIEIAARWSALDAIYTQSVAKLQSIPGILAASAHQSHAYPDGACLYFTFAGRNEQDTADDPWAEAFYNSAWEAVMSIVVDNGGAISHHHGIGLNRGRYMKRSLGESFGVLQSLKWALDPRGILNPGKLGLASQFGEVSWP